MTLTGRQRSDMMVSGAALALLLERKQIMLRDLAVLEVASYTIARGGASEACALALPSILAGQLRVAASSLAQRAQQGQTGSTGALSALIWMCKRADPAALARHANLVAALPRPPSILVGELCLCAGLRLSHAVVAQATKNRVPGLELWLQFAGYAEDVPALLWAVATYEQDNARRLLMLASRELAAEALLLAANCRKEIIAQCLVQAMCSLQPLVEAHNSSGAQGGRRGGAASAAAAAAAKYEARRAASGSIAPRGLLAPGVQTRSASRAAAQRTEARGCKPTGKDINRHAQVNCQDKPQLPQLAQLLDDGPLISQLLLTASARGHTAVLAMLCCLPGAKAVSSEAVYAGLRAALSIATGKGVGLARSLCQLPAASALGDAQVLRLLKSAAAQGCTGICRHLAALPGAAALSSESTAALLLEAARTPCAPCVPVLSSLRTVAALSPAELLPALEAAVMAGSSAAVCALSALNGSRALSTEGTVQLASHALRRKAGWSVLLPLLSLPGLQQASVEDVERLCMDAVSSYASGCRHCPGCQADDKATVLCSTDALHNLARLPAAARLSPGAMDRLISGCVLEVQHCGSVGALSCLLSEYPVLPSSHDAIKVVLDAIVRQGKPADLERLLGLPTCAALPAPAVGALLAVALDARCIGAANVLAKIPCIKAVNGDCAVHLLLLAVLADCIAAVEAVSAAPALWTVEPDELMDVLQLAVQLGNDKTLQLLCKLRPIKQMLNAENVTALLAQVCHLPAKRAACVDALCELDNAVSIEADELYNLIVPLVRSGHLQAASRLLALPAAEEDLSPAQGLQLLRELLMIDSAWAAGASEDVPFGSLPEDDFVSVLLDMQCIAEAEPEGLVRVLSLALQRGRLRVLGQMCMSDAPSTHDIEMEQAIQLMHEALACGRGQAIPLLGQLPQAEALSSDTLVQLLNAALNDPMRLNRDVVRYLCGAPSPGLFCSCGECFSPVQQAAARISADDVASLLTRALTLEGQVGMHAESTITMLSLLPGAQGMETKVVQDLLMAAVQADAGDVVGRLYGLPGARQLTRSDHAQLTSAALDVPGGCSDRLHAVLLSCSLPYDAAHASHMCQP